MRTATFQGVSWWVDAFDRAGLKGGFKVEWLPEGADPMDVRYNVVQWENRNERGWSVGGALTDPRTGEMLKGMARLDSHRARTDYNIYAAFMGADRFAGRHRVRPRARPPGERARSRPHARARPQLHREHVRARVGDGLSRAARAADERPDRLEPGVRRRTRRVRCVGDSLGLRNFPGRARSRFAQGDHGRRPEEGLPVPQRRRRAPRERRRSAHESLGRRRDARRFPQASGRRAPPRDGALRTAQRARRRSARAAAGSLSAALLLPSFRDQLGHEDDRRNGIRESAEGRRPAGDASDQRRASARGAGFAARRTAAGRARDSRYGAHALPAALRRGQQCRTARRRTRRRCSTSSAPRARSRR